MLFWVRRLAVILTEIYVSDVFRALICKKNSLELTISVLLPLYFNEKQGSK